MAITTNSGSTSIYGNIVGPVTVTGGSGASLSTSLTGGSWDTSMITAAATIPYTGSYTYGDTITLSNPKSNTLHVNGDAEFEGDITIKGVKLSERLDKIEERLGILRPNNNLEDKWEKLKALGEEYRRLEKEILEGESIWDTLKR